MKNNSLSRWHIEQFAAGELDPVARRQFEEQMRDDPELQRLVSEIQAENKQFSQTHPFERTKMAMQAGQVQRVVVRPAMQRNSLWVATAFASVAALLVSLSVFLSPTPTPTPTSEISVAAYNGADTVRLKGVKPRLRIFKRLDTGSEELVDGAFVAPNETLQLRYLAGGYPFGAIVSIDGGGGVTLHYPANAQTSSALAQNGEIALPYAYQLDNAPRFEKFVFVLSSKPLIVSKILDLARQQQALSGNIDVKKLELPAEAEALTMTLRKGGV